MRLAAGDWELTVAPPLGGAITSLRRRGRDVLRPGVAGATDPFLLGSFALLPYANRISNGVFAANGTPYRLPVNHDGQAHPLHGVGWLRPWDVAEADGGSLTLVHRYPGGTEWPWAYRAEQRLVLDETGLAIALSLTNDDTQAMPASLGFHPYFAADGVTAMQFGADGVWMRDEQCLPTTLAAADALGDWASGGAVQREVLIDNSYTGWSGTARIVHADGDLLLTGDGTPMLHVYTPPGEEYFCAEPTTSMPDAFNRTTPITLAPGQTHRIGMAIRTA